MKRTYTNFVSIYLFAYIGLGCMMPLLGQYLSEIGLSGIQIGAITATGTFIAIFASTFWGKVYGNNHKKIVLIMMLALCTVAASLFLPIFKVFAIILVLYAITLFFQTPVLNLIDALCIDCEQPFGLVRMWGAIGFAVGVFVAARVAASYGLENIFYMYSGGFLLAAIAFLFLNKDKGKFIEEKHNNEQTEIKKKTSDLLRNKKLVTLILCGFCVCGTTVANNTYFSFLYIEGGGTIAGVGIAFLLMVGSEAPFMALTKVLAKKLTMERLLLISMCISVVRFAWYSTGPSEELLLGTFFLQGMVNGIILVEIVRYVSKLVTPEYNGVAISAYYAISSNASTILCQFIGGALLDYTGPKGVYLFFAAFNLIGVILYLVFNLHKSEKSVDNVM